MDAMSVIITSFHQKDFTINCVKSYLYFCPIGFKLNLIVVENSDDISYKNEVLGMGGNITWVNNPTLYRGANANANGIEVGMKYVKDDYVFLSHNDICIASSNFFTSLSEKVKCGYQLVGTCFDIEPLRNYSIIVLGCLVKSDIVRSVDLYPFGGPPENHYYECGDRIHLYCRENNIPWFCFNNTHNNKELQSVLKEPYNSLLYTVITIDDYEQVIFLHFARGTDKTNNRYKKSGRLTLSQIIEFCNNIFSK